MRQGLLKIAAGVTSAMISTNIDTTQVYTVVRPLSKSKTPRKVRFVCHSFGAKGHEPRYLNRGRIFTFPGKITRDTR